MKTVPVIGNVTYNEQPLEEGRILFRAADNRVSRCDIHKGRFVVAASPGKLIVEITAYRKVPGKSTSANAAPDAVDEMYLPAEYNSKTTLSVDVAEGKPNAFDFHLTGTPLPDAPVPNAPAK